MRVINAADAFAGVRAQGHVRKSAVRRPNFDENTMDGLQQTFEMVKSGRREARQ